MTAVYFCCDCLVFLQCFFARWSWWLQFNMCLAANTAIITA